MSGACNPNEARNKGMEHPCSVWATLHTGRIPSQAKFAETAALRYATELAAGCNASLSLCVFPPSIERQTPAHPLSKTNKAHNSYL